MNNLETSNICLNEAMFVASHSYSGSSYDGGLFLETMCEEIVAFFPMEEPKNTVAAA